MIAHYILYSLSIAALILWMKYLLLSAYHGASIASLKDAPFEHAATYPKLSIVIAARNEEASIERALQSLLALPYPDLQIVIVNDRSTDATGAIIDNLAATDARLQVLHNTTLPKGWLGKVHALALGEKMATGEWLLFTDADIHFDEHVLERSVAYCEKHNLDHLAMLPSDKTQHSGFFLPLFVFAFGGLFVQRVRARYIGKPGSTAYVGVGAFNLVKRSTFERSAGFEWLRMEVIDDGGVGLLIHNVGGKSALLNADGLLSFEWYPTVTEAIKGLEKNAFGGFTGYSYVKAIATILSMWATITLPFIVAAIYGDIWLFVAALFFYSLEPALAVLFVNKGVKIKPSIAASLPIGYFLVSLGIVYSTISAAKNNGLRWRDTFYSLEELRRGRRVSI